MANIMMTYIMNGKYNYDIILHGVIDTTLNQSAKSLFANYTF